LIIGWRRHYETPPPPMYAIDAFIGHAIALRLSRRHDIEDAAEIVAARRLRRATSRRQITPPTPRFISMPLSIAADY